MPISGEHQRTPSSSGSSRASPAAAGPVSPAKLAEMMNLQTTYDQLLAISQQVYEQQHQQHQPAVKKPGMPGVNSQRHGSNINSGSAYPHSLPDSRQPEPAAADSWSGSGLCDGAAAQLSSECEQNNTGQIPGRPAHGLQDDSGDDAEQDQSLAQPSLYREPLMSVESALTLLSAAVASEDRHWQGSQHHRPASASANSNRQWSDKGGSCCARPQSAGGRSSRSGTCNGQLSARPSSSDNTTLAATKATLTRNLSQGHQPCSSSVGRVTSGTSAVQQCRAAAAVAAAAIRPRPASAPRMRTAGSSDALNPVADEAPSSHSWLSRVRPRSSSSRGCRTNDSSKTSILSCANDVGSNVHSSASQQCPRLAATTVAGKTAPRRRSSTCGTTRPAEHAVSLATVTAGALVSQQADADVASQDRSGGNLPDRSIIAAAMQEAKMALDAAVATAAVAGHAARPQGQHHAVPVECRGVHHTGTAVTEQCMPTVCTTPAGQGAAQLLSPGPGARFSSNKGRALKKALSTTDGGPSTACCCSQPMLSSSSQSSCSMLLNGTTNTLPQRQGHCVGCTSNGRCAAMLVGQLNPRRCSGLCGSSGLLDLPAGRLGKTPAASDATSYKLQWQLGAAGTAAVSQPRSQTNVVSAASCSQLDMHPWQATALKLAGCGGEALVAQMRCCMPVQQQKPCVLDAQLHGLHLTSTDDLSGAVLVGNGLRHRALLRHCSTGGLLGRLRLAEATASGARCRVQMQKYHKGCQYSLGVFLGGQHGAASQAPMVITMMVVASMWSWCMSQCMHARHMPYAPCMGSHWCGRPVVTYSLHILYVLYTQAFSQHIRLPGNCGDE